MANQNVFEWVKVQPSPAIWNGDGRRFKPDPEAHENAKRFAGRRKAGPLMHWIVAPVQRREPDPAFAYLECARRLFT